MKKQMSNECVNAKPDSMRSNSGFKEGDFPISEAAAKRVMSQPMWPDLTEAEQQSITATLCAASSKTEHHAVNT